MSDNHQNGHTGFNTEPCQNTPDKHQDVKISSDVDICQDKTGKHQDVLISSVGELDNHQDVKISSDVDICQNTTCKHQDILIGSIGELDNHQDVKISSDVDICQNKTCNHQEVLISSVGELDNHQDVKISSDVDICENTTCKHQDVLIGSIGEIDNHQDVKISSDVDICQNKTWNHQEVLISSVGELDNHKDVKISSDVEICQDKTGKHQDVLIGSIGELDNHQDVKISSHVDICQIKTGNHQDVLISSIGELDNHQDVKICSDVDICQNKTGNHQDVLISSIGELDNHQDVKISSHVDICQNKTGNHQDVFIRSNRELDTRHDVKICSQDELCRDTQDKYQALKIGSNGELYQKPLNDDQTVEILENHPSKPTNDWGVCIPRRFILTLLATNCTMWSFCMSFNMSVAIVAMVTVAEENATETECRSLTNHTDSLDDLTVREGEFHWSSELQGIVLGSLYYGYAIVQIPAGRLAERLGPRRVVGVSLAVNSLLAILTPVSTRISVYLLIVIRICQGISQGMTLPSVPVIVSKWAPVCERARINGLVVSGCFVGIALSQITAGYLADSGFLGGWPSVFYVDGSCGLLSAILWMFFVVDSPSQHPSMSAKELQYIEQNNITKKPREVTPWRDMLKSLPAWAIFVCNTTTSWVIFTMSSLLPTYMTQILHFNIKQGGSDLGTLYLHQSQVTCEITSFNFQNGNLSAIPIGATCILTNVGGVISDVISHRTSMETISVRKLMVGLGSFTTAAFIIAAGYTGCDVTIKIVLLSVGQGFVGFTLAGLYVNPIDIAQDYAGTLFGIANTLGTVPGFVAPYFAGYIINDEPTVEKWRLIFCVSGGICSFGMLFFLLFAEGQIQPWATEREPTLHTPREEPTPCIPQAEPTQCIPQEEPTGPDGPAQCIPQEEPTGPDGPAQCIPQEEPTGPDGPAQYISSDGRVLGLYPGSHRNGTVNNGYIYDVIDTVSAAEAV